MSFQRRLAHPRFPWIAAALAAVGYLFARGKGRL